MIVLRFPQWFFPHSFEAYLQGNSMAPQHSTEISFQPFSTFPTHRAPHCKMDDPGCSSYVEALPLQILQGRTSCASASSVLRQASQPVFNFRASASSRRNISRKRMAWDTRIFRRIFRNVQKHQPDMLI